MKKPPPRREMVVIDDRYYILAPTARIDEHSRVLKHDDTFAVFDRTGDIHSLGLGEEGLYHKGTRHLSRLELSLGGSTAFLLSSTVREDNALLGVDLTNADLMREGEVILPRDSLHIFRCAVLWKGACYVRFRLKSFGAQPIRLPLALSFEADFRDLFEIRGQKREYRGTLLAPALEDRSVRLSYRGLDRVERHTSLTFDLVPQSLTVNEANFEIALEPGQEKSFAVSIECEQRPASSTALRFEQARDAVAASLLEERRKDTTVFTANERFNDWLARSASDVHLMCTDLDGAPYPYAGIPWFSTPFGRDGIITALEFLWVNPELARGVLLYLARTQATVEDADRDAEPGKILHEARDGEMAALGEIPFGRYYGTVDATPLFVILAAEYYRRTADLGLIKELWPSIQRALSWIDEHGDRDGDGFIEYARRSKKGLVTQGWKDSVDSVFHADGALAEGPIALCEVQAYVYGARRAAQVLATALGETSRAEGFARQAENLRSRFERNFWSDELGTYVLALDGKKRPCKVRTSNAGQCLFTGIAAPDRALKVAATLLDEASYSGWGIRTVASTESRYNPMAYHNGSIWPHDNALIAAGFARYGLIEPLMRVFSGLFDASVHVDLQRMPELFCGFTRRPGDGPTLYPVACAPQAWAAACVYMLLQACIGLRIDAPSKRVELIHPALPSWLEYLHIGGLKVGEATVDLELTRRSNDVGVLLGRREGQVEVFVVK
jgi:glycogen debranching enzyme